MSFIDRIFTHPHIVTMQQLLLNVHNYVLEMCKGSLKTPIQVIKWEWFLVMLCTSINICIIAITILCQCFLHTSLHFVILSLSTDPGKGKEERATPQDSLHTEVKSECVQCVPVYLDVHQCVGIPLNNCVLPTIMGSLGSKVNDFA